jgi:excisionase family DNA binding protein
MPMRRSPPADVRARSTTPPDGDRRHPKAPASHDEPGGIEEIAGRKPSYSDAPSRKRSRPLLSKAPRRLRSHEDVPGPLDARADQARLLTQILYTVPEACWLLRMGRTRLYGLMNDEKLRALKDGRSTRFTRSELERYAASLDP